MIITVTHKVIVGGITDILKITGENLETHEEIVGFLREAKRLKLEIQGDNSGTSTD